VDTFLDYIKGGCEITLMIAIDFTVSEQFMLWVNYILVLQASNGAPTKPTSLHYCDRYLVCIVWCSVI